MSGITQRGRAVMLLEIVVAMAVMVTAMGFLGAQLVSGIKMTMYTEEQTRASQLADRMLALLELDPNTVTQFVAERQADGDFGEQYPEWFWRALCRAARGNGESRRRAAHQPHYDRDPVSAGSRRRRRHRTSPRGPQYAPAQSGARRARSRRGFRSPGRAGRNHQGADR